MQVTAPQNIHPDPEIQKLYEAYLAMDHEQLARRATAMHMAGVKLENDFKALHESCDTKMKMMADQAESALTESIKLREDASYLFTSSVNQESQQFHRAYLRITTKWKDLSWAQKQARVEAHNTRIAKRLGDFTRLKGVLIKLANGICLFGITNKIEDLIYSRIFQEAVAEQEAKEDKEEKLLLFKSYENMLKEMARRVRNGDDVVLPQVTFYGPASKKRKGEFGPIIEEISSDEDYSDELSEIEMPDEL